MISFLVMLGIFVTSAYSYGDITEQINNKTRDYRASLRFHTISRDEWLAKEYFGYLCAPEECVTDDFKEKLRNTCFDYHDKLYTLISNCFGNTRKCNSTDEERVLSCTMMASKADPSLIPLPLHDCVDDMINMKTWKCIRRVYMDKMTGLVDLIRGRKMVDHVEEANKGNNFTLLDSFP